MAERSCLSPVGDVPSARPRFLTNYTPTDWVRDEPCVRGPGLWRGSPHPPNTTSDAEMAHVEVADKVAQRKASWRGRAIEDLVILPTDDTEAVEHEEGAMTSLWRYLRSKMSHGGRRSSSEGRVGGKGTLRLPSSEAWSNKTLGGGRRKSSLHRRLSWLSFSGSTIDSSGSSFTQRDTLADR